jgi:hypothetical protein
MIIGNTYSFNNGEQYIRAKHLSLLQEVKSIIKQIDAESCRLKKPYSTEIKRADRAGIEFFYSPTHLNALFEYYFFKSGWEIKPRIKTNEINRSGYRELDFLKNRTGVEVQMGKYAFLTYDIVAKMPIFRNLDVIDCGIEICPMSNMLSHMSTGIGCFEQVMWDLEYRGSREGFDVPILLIGIMPELLAETTEATALSENEEKPTIVTNRYDELSKSILDKVKETGLSI